MEPDRNLLQVPSRPSNLQFVSAASENEVEVEGYGEGEDISDLGKVEHCSRQRFSLRPWRPPSCRKETAKGKKVGGFGCLKLCLYGISELM